MLYFTLYAKIETKCEGRKRMSEIKLTNEIFFALTKCKDAKSAMAMLKSKGYDVTEEKAESLWSAIQNHVLTDEELDKLTGGLIFLDLSTTKFACVDGKATFVASSSTFVSNVSGGTWQLN